MPGTLEEQIAQMQNFGGTPADEGGDPDDGPNTDAPDTGSAEHDDPSRDAPKGEEETPVDETGDKEGGTQEDETPPEQNKDEATLLKEENEYLRKKLEEVAQPEQGESAPAGDDPFAGVAAYDPIGDIPVDDIISDPESFKKWASTAFDGLKQTMFDSLKKALPQIVQHYAGESISSYDKAREFYDSHSDLKPYKSFVGKKMKEVAAKSKDKPLDELLNEVAAETRKELKLPDPADKARKAAKNSLPNKSTSSTHRRKATTELEGFDKEVEDMLSVIDH